MLFIRSLGAGVLMGFLSATLSAKSPEAAPKSATVDNIRVHYTNYGKGDFAVVFVHGWNCDESVWKAQVPAISAKTRVLTVDLPGHGQSDKPEVAYTMDVDARALDAVLQDAQVQSAVLVGHSNGTPVIRQYYRRFREKVRGLVIIDGALRPFGDAAFMEKFIAPMRGRDYHDTINRFIVGMLAPMKNEARREELKATMLNGPQHVAVSEMEGLLDPALWAEDKINVPVLMILAKQPAWTPEYEQFAHSFIPELDYQMWEGVSHFLMCDKPNEFNDALLGFLHKHAWLTK